MFSNLIMTVFTCFMVYVLISAWVYAFTPEKKQDN